MWCGHSFVKDLCCSTYGHHEYRIFRVLVTRKYLENLFEEIDVMPTRIANGRGGRRLCRCARAILCNRC